MTARRIPAWLVDPAWPVAPPLDDDELHQVDEPAPVELGAIELERLQLMRERSAVHAAAVNLAIARRRVQRLLQAPTFELVASAAPSRRPGRPVNRRRNDRLLALFELTPPHLSRMQRCRMTAQRFAIEAAEQARQPAGSARVMPAATVRDAVAEAMHRRRSGGA